MGSSRGSQIGKYDSCEEARSDDVEGFFSGVKYQMQKTRRELHLRRAFHSIATSSILQPLLQDLDEAAVENHLDLSLGQGVLGRKRLTLRDVFDLEGIALFSSWSRALVMRSVSPWSIASRSDSSINSSGMTPKFARFCQWRRA